MKALTVKELKEKLNDMPDDLELRLSSDSGVDQCEEGEIVITDAFKCGNTFDIYCNVYYEDEEDFDEEDFDEEDW